MNVLCIGFGFVGKAYALFLRELGHIVYVLTAEDDTKEQAEEYAFPIPSKEQEFDVAVVAVPTPTCSGEQDLTILVTVLDRLENEFKVGNVVVKSTVLPENIKKLARKYTKFTRFVVYPEFLEAKNPIGGVFNQECKVFGKTKWDNLDKIFIERLFGFYNNVTFTNLETACTLKYVHNIWLACNLSFWNSMMRTSAKGIDFDTILKETHKSKYFGTHPWHIGTAYGGTCLPKDTKAFISSIKKDGVFKKFIEEIDKVNEVVKNE